MTISVDTPCLACGYNLRGLATDGRCPECATPAHAPVMLHITWFRRVRAGLLLFAIGFSLIVIQLLIYFSLTFGAHYRSRYLSLFYTLRLDLILAAIPVVGLVLRWWGMMLIASRRLSPDSPPSDAPGTRSARLAAHATIVLFVLTWFFASRLIQAIGTTPTTSLYAILSDIVIAWLAWTLFTVLKDIGRTLHDQKLADQTNTVRFMLTAALAAHALEDCTTPLVEALRLPVRSSYTLATYLLGMPAAAVLLVAVIWSIFLFKRLSRRLALLQATAPSIPPDPRSPYIPDVFRRIQGIVTYRGSHI